MAKTTHHATHSDLSPTDGTASFLTIEELVKVMDQLRFIIEEENEFLRRGMPSSLFEWREQKQELSDRYAEITARIAKGIENGLHLDTELLRALIGGTLTLKGLTDENLKLLDGAMKATRRRIEAVVATVRRERMAASPYAEDGRPWLARFVPHSSRLTI